MWSDDAYAAGWMKMPTLPVSVVIPVYNRRSLLANAIRSVRAQVVQPRDVIVVDDGSVDGSGKEARRLGATVITQENAGSSGARNAGLRAAQTDWVAFLDSDDRWLPEHLAVVSPHLRDEKLALISTTARREGQKLVGAARRSPLQLKRAEELLWPWNPVVTSGSLVRRSAAEAAGGFDVSQRYNEDLDLWVRMLGIGHGLVLPQVTVEYVVHGSQASAQEAEMREGLLRLARQRGSSAVVAKVESREFWDNLRGEKDLRTLGLHGLKELVRPTRSRAIIELVAYRALAKRTARTYFRTHSVRGDT